jgi:Bacterial membrane protein YfhO
MPDRRARLSLLIIPVVLAALTLLYMMPFVRPPTGREVLDGHDLVDQQYPLLSFIFDSVRDGNGLPLWNPYQFAGQSTVANPQSTLFYPPAWIMIPLGVPRGAGWLIALHLWLGAWGMAAFARQLGASREGALIGGIVYSFSALMGAHLGAGHLNYLLCQAWLPWIAAAYLWAANKTNWLLAALPGAAALGLCILSGYPPLLYFALLWLVGLWLYVSLQAPSDRVRAALLALRPLVVIVVVGAILGAALLLPVGQFTLRSTRTQGASIDFSNSYALPGGQLMTLVFPNMFGHPRLPDQGYWGLPFYEETTAYFGILPLAAIFLAFRLARRRAALLLVVFAAVGLVVSLGVDGGLFPVLYWLLPGYSIFRVPSRALYFVVVGAAGLAALLITDLQDLDTERRSWLLRPAVNRLLPLLGILAILTSLGFVGYYTAHSADPNPPWRALYSGNVIGVAVVAIGAAWMALRAWSGGAKRFALALTFGVIVLDLWHISQPLVTVSAVDVPPLWQAVAKVVPGSPDYRVMTVPNQIIWQAGVTYTRHLNASGYDPLVGDAYQRLLDASQYNPTSPVARLLGVRYVIGDKPYEWSKLPGIERLNLLATQDGWLIYEVRDPLPRAFVAPQILVIADDETARKAIMSGEIDVSTTSTVDHPVDCPADAPTGSSPARIVHYAPNAVEVEASRAGLLVLSDAYDPNWTVTLDGSAAVLLRVDTALRGVCLPAGSHRVRFEYRPTLFFVGAAISVVGWLALGLIGLATVLRRYAAGHQTKSD